MVRPDATVREGAKPSGGGAVGFHSSTILGAEGGLEVGSRAMGRKFTVKSAYKLANDWVEENN